MTTPSSPAIGSDRAAVVGERRPVAATSGGRVLRAAAWGGLIAGVLDIGYVLVLFPLWLGSSPVRILQGIAAALIGPGARDGGLATAALGLFCHFVIATGAAATYALAATTLTLLTRRPIFSGLVFGVCVYLFMQWVVLPLSATGGGRGPNLTWPSAAVVLAHLVCVGIPIALCTKRAFSTSR